MVLSEDCYSHTNNLGVDDVINVDVTYKVYRHLILSRII